MGPPRVYRLSTAKLQTLRTQRTLLLRVIHIGSFYTTFLQQFFFGSLMFLFYSIEKRQAHIYLRQRTRCWLSTRFFKFSNEENKRFFVLNKKSVAT